MPRATLDLQNADDLSAVGGQWKVAHGFVPDQPNEGIVPEAEGSPCRLPDYDDSGWEDCGDLGAWRRRGVSFIWYRIKATLPETVGGRASGRSEVPLRVLHRRLRRDLDQRRVRPGTRHGPGVQRSPARCGLDGTQARRRGNHRYPGHERPAGRARRRSVCALRQPGLRVAGSRILGPGPHHRKQQGRVVTRP